MLVEALVNQGWQKVEKEGHTFVHDPHTTIVWKFVAPYSLMYVGSTNDNCSIGCVIDNYLHPMGNG